MLVFGAENLYAVNASTGSLLWRVDEVFHDVTKEVWYLVLDDVSNVIYCVSIDNIAAVSLEGHVLWITSPSNSSDMNLLVPAFSSDRQKFFVTSTQSTDLYSFQVTSPRDWTRVTMPSEAVGAAVVNRADDVFILGLDCIMVVSKGASLLWVSKFPPGFRSRPMEASLSLLTLVGYVFLFCQIPRLQF